MRDFVLLFNAIGILYYDLEGKEARKYKYGDKTIVYVVLYACILVLGYTHREGE